MNACKYVGRNEPRIIPGEHYDECGGGCDGCWPCPERHCGTCGTKHTDHANPVTCPGCVGDVRGDLATIRVMCGALPDEVKHRGVNGTAMVLLGPAADPEAWNHAEASYLAGRLPEGWLETTHGRDCPRDFNEACTGCADSELHPLLVLGTWDMVWRDYLEHDESAERLTVLTAGAYLDSQLTYMAQVDDVPFGDLATDVRRCLDHMRAVVHDQDHGDRANVGCFDCGGSLERKLRDRRPGGDKDDRGGFEDQWTCRKCRRRYTYAEYNFALRAALEQEAS